MIKFQTLAIIFILLVVPISLLLTYYINSQIDVIATQNSYDTKLLNATYDAIIAFQLNTMNNNGYSTNAESLRRDINASINTFKTSLANNFGVGNSYMLPYIPAMVYTLYDGYYIYSPIASTKVDDTGKSTTTFEHTLKPYMYYTARYYSDDPTNKFDIVVNYSLDNYITVYGNINGGYIAKAGYLTYLDKYEDIIDGIIAVDPDPSEVKPDTPTAEKYYKGYKDENIADLGIKDFSTDIIEKLKDIEVQDIVVEVSDDGKIITAKDLQSTDTKNQYYEFKNNNSKIFDVSEENDPEVKTSTFWEHKNSVIRKSIESNLNSAINNYTKQSEGLGTTYDFLMPILSENEWNKVLSNVSIITFMQGLPMGMKTYNNYMIVSSTGNRQFVDPESLYFVTKTADGEEGKYYHRINCPLLAEELTNDSTLSVEGYSSIDFKGIYTEKDEEGNEIKDYTYNHKSYACYECIVSSKVGGIVYDSKDKDTSNKQYYSNDNNNLITFLTKNNGIDYSAYYNANTVEKLINAYYNALFKERFNLVKVSQYINGAI